jgi:hypothetical protein
MEDLIKALEIMVKYNPKSTTHCEHDVLIICGVEPDEVSEEDIELMKLYGFHIGDSCGEDAFESFRWGSC